MAVTVHGVLYPTHSAGTEPLAAPISGPELERPMTSILIDYYTFFPFSGPTIYSLFFFKSIFLIEKC